MEPQETLIPGGLLDYMEGLKTHDVTRIASTLADDIRFVTPARTMGREEVLAFLAALYRGFPDWHYGHERPEPLGCGLFKVLWRQGGTHTGRLEFPGFDPVESTGKSVKIPEQFFFYRVSNNRLTEIRPDPVPGGAPRGIFEQIGVKIPPL